MLRDRVIDIAMNHRTNPRPRTLRTARLFGLRVLSWLTNYVINHIPSFTLRHLWYRRVLGVQLGTGSAIFLGCFIWNSGPRHMRRAGLRIGDYCLINRNCCLDARGSLSIGNNVSISPDVMILTLQHFYNHPEMADDARPVVIEDHVWIGTRAMILPGVTIGRGAVVAAGALVTKNVAPRAVVGGVPAKPIGQRELDPDYTLDYPLPWFE